MQDPKIRTNMSDKQENTEAQPDAPEASAPSPVEVEQASPASTETSANSTSEPTKAVVFGTRKSRPGAKGPSTAKSLSQVRGVYDDDDDEIVMDDLPSRATAPEHLIANERAPRPERREENRDRPNRRERSNDRPRSRRREDTPKDSDSEETKIEAFVPSAAILENKEATPSTEAAAPTEETTQDDRPDRFGTISKETLDARQANSIEEFRPTRDGRVSTKKPEDKSDRSDRNEKRTETTPKKKGFFAWLKSLFVAEEEIKQPTQNRRRNNRGRGPRGQNREGGENRGEDGQNRRPRRRGPRREGNNENRPSRESSSD